VEGAATSASMRLSELSVGGCYVDTRMTFSEGTPVTIRAMFPGADLTFTGKILYAHPGYGFGVGFDPLPDPVREKLEDYLKQASSA
jgi:hypothetical protein